jgi:hypothetical protein
MRELVPEVQGRADVIGDNSSVLLQLTAGPPDRRTAGPPDRGRRAAGGALATYFGTSGHSLVARQSPPPSGPEVLIADTTSPDALSRVGLPGSFGVPALSWLDLRW